MSRPGRTQRLVCALLAMTCIGAPSAADHQAAPGRVVLVGLDGASWNVIDPMIESGELPNLASISEDGVTAELETVEPVTSPVVWTSIATGRTPENHGVTDFFSSALDIETPTVFERLSARGVRVGLYDFLMTWPPVDLPKGFVIPGWLRQDESVSPPDVWSRVQIEPWVNAYDPLKTNDDYRRNALAETRRKASRWNALADHFHVQVGAVSFYAPDAMSHRFWHGAYPDEFEPEVSALANDAERVALVEAMRGVDRAIGEIRARLGPEDSIIVVSDHGFRAKPDTRDVWVSHFQRMLPDAKLDPKRDGFAVLSEFGQLVVRVLPGEFAEADATASRLAELIESVQTAEGDGLYWAAEVLDVAPRPPGAERSIWNRLRQWVIVSVLEQFFDVELDPNSHAVILALPRSGVLEGLGPEDTVRVAGRDESFADVFSRQLFTGEHDPIAIFLAAGGPIAPRSERGRLSVLDVSPLIFHLAGAPVPDDLEGAVPEQFIDPNALATRPVALLAADDMPGIDRTPRSLGDPSDPELTEKLRRLGYIE